MGNIVTHRGGIQLKNHINIHLTISLPYRKPYLPVKVELKDARAYLGLVIISAQTDRHFISKHSDS